MGKGGKKREKERMNKKVVGEIVRQRNLSESYARGNRLYFSVKTAHFAVSFVTQYLTFLAFKKCEICGKF